MTNKDRQRSLTKKNGMNGTAPYCIYCSRYIRTGLSPNRMIGCIIKEGPEHQYDCAKAYNRMARSKNIITTTSASTSITINMRGK